VAYASEIGCALNCDLNTGLTGTGAAATDDGPTIRAFLANATANNPLKLIIDGGALVSGLFLPAGGHCAIEGLGWDTGFYQKSGTNNDCIHNGVPTANLPSDPGYTLPVPARGSNVVLRNFKINGNAGDGTNGNSTTGDTRGSGTNDVWYYGINLMSLNNIRIENVWVYNPSAYHIRVSNVGDVVVDGCRLESPGPGYNTDGVHVDGPSNDIRVANSVFNCGDDAIALNCPEGWSGNIERVQVVNCAMLTCITLMRLYTSTVPPNPQRNIDSVTVSNCTALCTRSGFLLGEYDSSSADSVRALSISNCNIAAPMLIENFVSFGAVSVADTTWSPASSEGSTVGLLNTIDAGSSTNVGSSLTFDNCRIYRDGSSDYGTAAIVLRNGFILKKLRISGVAVEDTYGSSYAPLSEFIQVVSGSIGHLLIDALDPTQISTLVSSGSFSSTTAVAGPGVKATGFQVPDANMVNGSDYLSATSGLPSIKIGGVVKTYTVT
jgi:hypothetical protein